ncbi:2-oxoacid:acceptor oxidoreductase family protein [Propionimicrobium sp. PCR01-08-3]|uniref:2-oxoacid:acceptor oxidoreductase family protein n=1 Tax=Propionimicrobium sp. PCR01-08-3 TaxID=3052086 RepID=UPI00255C5B58|nr:2-oxoacid:acceptor oxidoreductase family protein [Propionimicrobium sp. PCR01-08-3]WIY84021.1 2-oxoacid:acceptor oxidoreductase family protein [Propionimicrobium sp. PCR01-08-3]
MTDSVIQDVAPASAPTPAPDKAKYPGTAQVINGNGAVAHVMKHVCGGVIGYPITPSTEISEIYEAAVAEGQLNVWGKHPFFFEPEGEHSAQSGALGAALTGGQFVSNASSSQGILYAMESHFVTVGKKVGGFVLQVAARVVSKHSLNVMAGHDDVYALLPSGYTVFFGSNPQEAADLAAISYRTSALSLIPVANAMDGFATSHMLSEARLPEPELLKNYLGDPAGRIDCPTVAQEIIFGAKGRVWQLRRWIDRKAAEFGLSELDDIRDWLDRHADAVEHDDEGELIAETLRFVPADLAAQWRRQWLGALRKGTRQLVPALVDPTNPGLTGPVQNQPDFQAGIADHRTHFAAEVPRLARQAMDEYSALTGRPYAPVMTYDVDDADYVFVGLGSVCDDIRAVMPYLRSQGIKVGLVAVKLLQPFPEAELVAAVRGKKAVTIMERSDQMALTGFVNQAIFRGAANAAHPGRFPGIEPIDEIPAMTSAIFGLGGHDLQPRDLVAAAQNMAGENASPLVYLGSTFFSEESGRSFSELEAKLAAAYPETTLMALPVGKNPQLLPDKAMRIRFHSVGGYGTIATGKLMTDILAGALGLYSKSAPKYGSEKSGAPTNYYITLSPEPVLVTNAELEDVEVVLSPDHKVFQHTNPLKGLVAGGTLIMQSNLPPEQAWRALPAAARTTIREKKIKFSIIDAFSVAAEHAPTAELQTRMMGIAFIGAVVGGVDRISHGTSVDALREKVYVQINKKFGRKGSTIVSSNMAVIEDGLTAVVPVPYDQDAYLAIDAEQAPAAARSLALSAAMCPSPCAASNLFDADYYEHIMGKPFREGTVDRAPVFPGSGLFVPSGTAAGKDKGMFRRTVPIFDATLCTGCMECTLACPDAAIPNAVHEIHTLIAAAVEMIEVNEPQRAAMRDHIYSVASRVREYYRADKDAASLADLVAKAADELVPAASGSYLRRNFGAVVEVLRGFPVARTRPFFDAIERETPGNGGLYSVTIDPWKCTGCLECVDVCGPNALASVDQTPAIEEKLETGFEFLTKTPNTPARFTKDAVEPGGDTKRLFLDRANYYTVTGGHGGCRGCGEVTSTRMVMATSHALGSKRQTEQRDMLTTLIDQLQAKLAELEACDQGRAARIGSTVDALEKGLYLLEGGPNGKAPATTVVANSTGCSSVYASTMPFNAFTDPWVNSLFQDAQALAKGVFEGLAAKQTDLVKAVRTARLELDDAYDTSVHDKELATLDWAQFTDEELAWMPAVLTIGGDGANYDIGFGALSRILASGTPVKMMVLDTGGYSNTGGQASTASFIGQDADLARVGAASTGKTEGRKELAILAAFHPNTYVAATATAFQGHFLRAAMDMLNFTDGASLVDVYTPCQGENGIADNMANQRGRLAVESRMAPLFVHDPRKGDNLRDWFDLDANPDPDKLWANHTIEYVDETGNLNLAEFPLTPAQFAFAESRFKKQFGKLPADQDAVAVPVEEFIDLPEADRATHVPFFWSTDATDRLVKIKVSASIVAMVEERRRNWQLLQYLAGVDIERLKALHKTDLDDLQSRYDDAMAARESSMDEIAAAMSDLAASTSAQPVAGFGAGFAGFGGFGGGGQSAPAAQAEDTGQPIVRLAPEDVAKCTDCKNCWQELPELFERTKVIVDDKALDAARLIPGAIDKVEPTDELRKRIAKVVANCDAEIIH